MPNQGGLYIIWLSDSHYYGGRTSNFKHRWKNHLLALQRGLHSNCFMQAVFNIHGRFEPSILETENDPNSRVTQEQRWLDSNVGKEDCVNFNKSALGPQGCVRSAETRAKMSAAALRRAPPSKETCKKISLAKTGYVNTPEARARMSEGQSRRAPPTPETREKLRARRASEDTKKLMSEKRREDPLVWVSMPGERPKKISATLLAKYLEEGWQRERTSRPPT